MKITIPNAKRTPNYTVKDLAIRFNELIGNGFFVAVGDDTIQWPTCANNDYTKLICFVALWTANKYDTNGGGPYLCFRNGGGEFCALDHNSIKELMVLLSGLNTAREIQIEL